MCRITPVKQTRISAILREILSMGFSLCHFNSDDGRLIYLVGMVCGGGGEELPLISTYHEQLIIYANIVSDSISRRRSEFGEGKLLIDA